MNYQLRCPYTVQCGQWDYLTYAYLYKPLGILDSVSHLAPSYVVNGSSPDSFQYITSPSYSFHPHFQQHIVLDSTISYSSSQVGSFSNSYSHPFNSYFSASRTQYIWRASELTAAGLHAGNISDLQFNLDIWGPELRNLTIRMKTSTLDSLTDSLYEKTGFSTVYERNTNIPGVNWQTIQLTTPFYWDGVSNIDVDLSFNTTNSCCAMSTKGESTSYPSCVYLPVEDRSLFFEGTDDVKIPAQALASVDSFITIGFWSKGNPAYMPENCSIFEAWDTSNHRVLNIHLPWGDGTIYWDAGNSGTSSFDRVSKAATAADYAGNWTYWTFVKNVSTGRLKIYKNGAVFIQATGKHARMYGISKIRIGGGLDNNTFYDGNIDDFTVFNAEVPQATIQQWMYKRVDASHPYYQNLILHYNFDDSSSTTVTDHSVYLNDGQLFGIPATGVYGGTEIFKDMIAVNERPEVIFGQGTYLSHVDSSLVVDSTANAPLSVVFYSDTLNPTTPTDTVLVWNTYYNNYIYDSLGNATDSMAVAADTTIHLANTTYYDAPYEVNDRFELGRYITPYGNGLSLGNGFMWKYDVSDYEPLLHDTVHLTAGNNEELLDLSFDIIKGTPPRDVHNIKNIWTGDIGWTATVENALNERKVLIPADAQNSRLKVRLTGHGSDQGNCAEFCPNTCYLFIDSVQRYSHYIWRDNCDLNPLYPQGGTWVYERANWCPGAEVETYDMELTPYVTPGDSSLLNLNLNPHNWTSAGWPNYVTETQLITYGAPNFTLDAAIYEIKAPSDKQLYQRMNPICNNPLITIQNTGSDTLHSLTITYGLVGGTPSTFTWSGNLAFMDKQDVRLGNFAWNSADYTFYATLSNPNGGVDQYANNNTAHSTIVLPEQFDNQLIFELKTNNEPYQNVYDIKDDQGNLIFHKGGGLTTNTYYNDTITFPSGCYEFKLTDSGEDGLTWWANTAGGSGYMRIKRASDGAVIKTYNSDFGGEIYQQFTVGYLLNTNELQPLNEVNVFPNPSSGIFQTEILLDKKQNVTIEVFDLTGRLVYKNHFENVIDKMIDVDLSQQTPGIYHAHIITSGKEWMKKMVVAK